jgi:hypothetical protein
MVPSPSIPILELQCWLRHPDSRHQRHLWRVRQEVLLPYMDNAEEKVTRAQPFVLLARFVRTRMLSTRNVCKLEGCGLSNVPNRLKIAPRSRHDMLPNGYTCHVHVTAETSERQCV